jgi:hypothetical protein
VTAGASQRLPFLNAERTAAIFFWRRAARALGMLLPCRTSTCRRRRRSALNETEGKKKTRLYGKTQYKTGRTIPTTNSVPGQYLALWPPGEVLRVRNRNPCREKEGTPLYGSTLAFNGRGRGVHTCQAARQIIARNTNSTTCNTAVAAREDPPHLLLLSVVTAHSQDVVQAGLVRGRSTVSTTSHPLLQDAVEAVSGARSDLVHRDKDSAM